MAMGRERSTKAYTYYLPTCSGLFCSVKRHIKYIEGTQEHKRCHLWYALNRVSVSIIMQQ